jgi:hypothetical protein
LSSIASELSELVLVVLPEISVPRSCSGDSEDVGEVRQSRTRIDGAGFDDKQLQPANVLPNAIQGLHSRIIVLLKLSFSDRAFCGFLSSAQSKGHTISHAKENGRRQRLEGLNCACSRWWHDACAMFAKERRFSSPRISTN